MSHLLSAMDEPIGRAVGNALEVAECVEILRGGGPSDLVKLILDLAAKVSTTPRAQLEKRLGDGSAWKKFVALVYAQDGDATALEKIVELHRARVIQPFPAKTSGIVKKMDAELIGRASVLLGAGRHKTEDAIDYAVGFSAIKKIGEHADLNEPLLLMHARNERSLMEVAPLLEKAVEVAAV
jgi:thymidine phosphorylase